MLGLGTSTARKGQGKNALEASDPSQRRVFCTWEAWDARIVPGHPEVADLQEEIRAAVGQPLRTRTSGTGARARRSYYGRGPAPPLGDGDTVEVVCLPQGQIIAVRFAGQGAGLASAVEQIEAGALGREAWNAAYDPEGDIVRLRLPDAGPAITYESPAFPDFLVRLDIRTELLTGIDLMDAKSRLEEHSKRLRGLASALSALGGKRRESAAVDPAELVSNFIAVSPVRLAASGNGVTTAS